MAKEITNPGSYRPSALVNGVLILLTVIGAAALVGGLMTDAKRTWFSFVHNHFYFMSLAIGGIFFVAIHWLTSAMWSTPIRRVCEAFTGYLPVAILTFAILFFGIHDLYPWSHPEHVKGDLILEGKAGYLNIPFFMIRNLIALGAMTYFARRMIGNSVAQDVDGDIGYTKRNKVLAPGFLILFAIGYTMASFDQMMSLDPHWFSTMFGVYCFAGLFYQILAATTLVTIFLKRRGMLEGIVNENHLHDLGKYLFAFTIFWAYIGFSQFMLTWYANLPEETGYFIHRFQDGWIWVSIFLLVGKFLTPFLVLLPRDAKRNETILIGISIFMLIAQWIDVLWMVQPEYSASGPVIGWQELGVTALFLGVFGLCVVRFLSRNNVVAIRDPRLPEAVFHHHQ